MRRSPVVYFTPFAIVALTLAKSNVYSCSAGNWRSIRLKTTGATICGDSIKSSGTFDNHGEFPTIEPDVESDACARSYRSEGSMHSELAA